MKRSGFIRFIIVALAVFAMIFAVNCGAAPDFSSGSQGGGYYPNYPGSGDEWEGFSEGDFLSVSENPRSTFSLERSGTSYAYIRRQLIDANRRVMLQPASIKVEEIINYFDYDYAAPEEGEALALSYGVSDCPWNGNHKLMTVGVKTADFDLGETGKNIVFLLDVSGSMASSDKLGLIQTAFTSVLSELNPTDVVSIVVYAGEDRVLCEGVPGSEKMLLEGYMTDLTAGGSTNGSGGISRAFEIASRYKIEGGVNKVIMATDGDFNVGFSSTEELSRFVKEYTDSGIDFTVLGVGMGNYKNTTIETVAQNAGGNYGYLDSLAEANRLLIENFGGTFKTVAKDAKALVEFSGAVEKYRLIGYENKLISYEDFSNPSYNSGDIGSGLEVTAVYELKLSGTPVKLADFTVNYKNALKSDLPDETRCVEIDGEGNISANDRNFIACAAEFGLLLRESNFMGDATYDAVLARLEALPEEYMDEYKTQFISVIKKAKQYASLVKRNY